MYGFETFISLEPVIIPKQALHLIKMLHGCVDYWKIGKINHNREIESGVNWYKFREQAKDVLAQYNCNYMLKRSLTDL